MGIFTGNTLYSISGVDYSGLPALEGYDATVGCATAMLEAQQNDMALFNAAIMEDFKEVAAVNEGVEVLNESAKDVLLKVKEIFMKLLQKIKGIFQAFLAKLAGTFISGSKLYDNYKDQITKYNKWKNFSVKKFRKGKGTSIFSQISTVGKYLDGNAIEYSISTENTFGMDITKDDLDMDDIRKALISDRLSNDINTTVDEDFKNMNTSFMDAVFEDEDTKDEWQLDQILNGDIGALIKKDAGKKFKESVEDANKNLNDTISKIISKINKEAEEINKLYGKAASGEDTTASYTNKKISSGNTTAVNKNGFSTNKYNSTISSTDITDSKNVNTTTGSTELQKLSKAVANIQKIAVQEQQLITSLVAARLNTTKFAIAQARRVWSSAAAYSSTEHKNEGYEFYTAIGEATAYDFMTDMEAIEA